MMGRRLSASNSENLHGSGRDHGSCLALRLNVIADKQHNQSAECYRASFSKV